MTTPLPGSAAPASPLEQLADIQLPEPVSLWPLAPGWYLLLTLALLVAVALYYWRRHRQQQRYRQLALAQLQQAQADYLATQQAGNPQLAVYLQALNRLLRRTAASAGAPQAALSLSGSAWLHWLDQSATTLPGRFSDQTLLLTAYQKNPSDQGLEQAQALAIAWIKHHRHQRFNAALALASHRPNNHHPSSHHPSSHRTNTEEHRHV